MTCACLSPDPAAMTEFRSHAHLWVDLDGWTGDAVERGPYVTLALGTAALMHIGCLWLKNGQTFQ